MRRRHEFDRDERQAPDYQSGVNEVSGGESPSVGVVGAGGRTGRRIVAALARHGLGARGLSRSLASLDVAQDAGATEVSQVDLADPESLNKGIRGLDTLVFIAPPFSDDEQLYAANALAAASAQGVEHFVYHSVLHPFLPGVPHHLRKVAVEASVRDSGLGWTITQPSMYQQLLLGFVQGAGNGAVVLPYSPASRFNLVDLEDVAEAVARIVAAPADHACASYELAGPHQLSMTEMVDQVARVVGRRLRVEEVPSPLGSLPPNLSRRAVAEMMAMWAEYDRNGLTGNSNVLRFLLGREPSSLEATARRELLPNEENPQSLLT
jgi:NAD(P)H dehydrogenase (quinone)